MKKAKHIKYILTTPIFLIILLFPTANSYLKLINNDISKIEKRKPNKEPEFDISYLDPFPNEYEKYYDDNFGLRKLYLKAFNFINYKYFRRSASTKTTIGKNNFIFLRDSYLPSISDTTRFDKQTLATFRKKIKARNKYYKSKGIDWYLIIAPGKATMYPEMIPDQYSKNEGYFNRTEQLMNSLKKHNLDSNVLYLKDSLYKHKKSNPLYYRIDHHWNKLGAFYGAKSILNLIRKNNPQIPNHTKIRNYKITWETITYGNLTSAYGGFKFIEDSSAIIEPINKQLIIKKGKKRNYKAPKYFAYKWAYEYVKKSNFKGLPKALIIRDSYSKSLIPFLSTGFSESIYIWDAWKYKINEKIVNDYKPDIVLTIMVETKLEQLLE
jgi:alginate O-acetyltransferase complex protein AlgJ